MCARRRRIADLKRKKERRAENKEIRVPSKRGEQEKKKKRKKKKKSPTLQDSLFDGTLGIVSKKEVGKGGALLLQIVEEEVEDLNSDWVLAVHKEGVRKIIKTVAINHSCLKSLSEIAQDLEAIG